MAACTLSRRYYLMQLLLHIPSWWGAKQHHFSPAPLTSPPAQSRRVWLTERRAEIIPSLLDVTSVERRYRHTADNLWVVRGDKSHGKLDSDADVKVSIDHGSCAFPKRFIKHSCLHLKHDSSLTQQMPVLSILLARSSPSSTPLRLLPLCRKNWGVRMCTAWRTKPTQD